MSRILWKKRDLHGEFVDLDRCCRAGCTASPDALYSADCFRQSLPPTKAALCDTCANVVRHHVWPPKETAPSQP